MSEEQTTAKSNWKDREIGALWKKQGPKQTYLSGTIEVDNFGTKEKVSVVIYTNKYKEKENQPDFRVYRSESLKKKSEEENSVKETEQESNNDNDILD